MSTTPSDTMSMDVTDVLRHRLNEPPGPEHTVTMMISLLAHGTLVGAILFTPGFWWRHRPQAPTTVMTIMLGGGAPGPASGGQTPEGGRPVQAVKPPDEPRRPEPVRSPAAKTPEMTLPTPRARPQKTAPAPVHEAPADARGHTPTRGTETRTGSAVAETGARGQGGGLSTGGGGGTGLYLDVANFCCPDYLSTMIERIRANWDPRAGTSGEVVIKFTIQRNGQITGTLTEKSSGNAILDLAAQRAVYVTRQVPPLPEPYTNPTLTLHLIFQYQR